MRTLRLMVAIAAAIVTTGTVALAASAATVVPVSARLVEPFKAGPVGSEVCPDIGLAVNCGYGELRPYGRATSIVSLDACGEGCGFRWITTSGGTVVLRETVSDFSCPGACAAEWPHGAPFSAVLTAVVVGGTGVFEGAGGAFTGILHATVWEAQIRYSGSLMLDL
jgi:hypothetical protein